MAEGEEKCYWPRANPSLGLNGVVWREESTDATANEGGRGAADDRQNRMLLMKDSARVRGR